MANPPPPGIAAESLSVFDGFKAVDTRLDVMQAEIDAGAGGSKQPLNANLTSLSGASEPGIYYRLGGGFWSPVTIGSGLTFSSGLLSAAGGAASGVTYSDTLTSLGVNNVQDAIVALYNLFGGAPAPGGALNFSLSVNSALLGAI